VLSQHCRSICLFSCFDPQEIIRQTLDDYLRLIAVPSPSSNFCREHKGPVWKAAAQQDTRLRSRRLGRYTCHSCIRWRPAIVREGALRAALHPVHSNCDPAGVRRIMDGAAKLKLDPPRRQLAGNIAGIRDGAGHPIQFRHHQSSPSCSAASAWSRPSRTRVSR
jgi:hypothetical protein